jgi:hypothetical protein
MSQTSIGPGTASPQIARQIRTCNFAGLFSEGIEPEPVVVRRPAIWLELASNALGIAKNFNLLADNFFRPAQGQLHKNHPSRT